MGVQSSTKKPFDRVEIICTLPKKKNLCIKNLTSNQHDWSVITIFAKMKDIMEVTRTLWALSIFPSHARVTSQKLSLCNNCINMTWRLLWWYFHRRQYCWAETWDLICKLILSFSFKFMLTGGDDSGSDSIVTVGVNMFSTIISSFIKCFVSSLSSSQNELFIDFSWDLNWLPRKS